MKPQHAASMEASTSTRIGAQPQSSWSSLFPSAKAAHLKFHQSSISDDKPSVFIPKSVHHHGIAVWENCLVGQFFGSSPSFSQVQAVAHQIWGRRNRVDVLRLDNGFFLFRFENFLTRDWVLEGGQWFAAQRPLLLKNGCLVFLYRPIPPLNFLLG